MTENLKAIDVAAVYRAESRAVLATLIRLLGDFDLAEEAVHEAFRAALEQWPREGVPARIEIRPVEPGLSAGSVTVRRLPDSPTRRSR